MTQTHRDRITTRLRGALKAIELDDLVAAEDLAKRAGEAIAEAQREERLAATGVELCNICLEPTGGGDTCGGCAGRIAARELP